MVCGIVNINNETYMFRLEGNNLHAEAIAHIGKSIFVVEWMQNRPQFNGEFLEGVNQITGNRIIFKTLPGEAGFKNSELTIPIQYYIEFLSDDKISRISIKCDELNYIYHIQNGIETYSFCEEGTTSFQTKSFDETTSDKEYFTCCGKKVAIYFTIYRGIQLDSSTPLTLNSSIMLEFEESDDYDFIYRLICEVKLLIEYLCYRQNVHITEIDLHSIQENQKFQKFGTFYQPKWQAIDFEDITIIKKRYISYKGIKGHVGAILQDLEDEKLYIRHLPEDYHDSKRINHSKFIMITAAIEWISKELYPDGITHSIKTESAIEQVGRELDERIANSKGKVKEKYKLLRNVLGSTSLSSRINQLCLDYSNIITPFGKYLYDINGELPNFNYAKLSQRIEKQRNNFAHGNLDKEYDALATLDILLLERAVYCLQLSKYGIDDAVIISEVKRLFGMRFI